MLRRILKSAAAAVALTLASASFAQAETVLSGRGTLSYQYNDFEIEGLEGDASADTFGIEGSLAAPLDNITEGLAFQINGGYAYSELEVDGGGEADGDAYTGTGHLFFRQSDAGLDDGFLFGVLAGLVDFEDGDTVYGAGVEGFKYLENTTVGGRFVWLTGDDSDFDLYNFEGNLRQFINDDFFVQGGASIGSFESDGGDFDETIWSVHAMSELRVPNSPVSVGGLVSYTDVSELETVALKVFASVNFGTGSLKDRNRRGDDLEPIGAGLTGLLSAVSAASSESSEYEPPVEEVIEELPT